MSSIYMLLSFCQTSWLYQVCTISFLLRRLPTRIYILGVSTKARYYILQLQMKVVITYIIGSSFKLAKLQSSYLRDGNNIVRIYLILTVQYSGCAAEYQSTSIQTNDVPLHYTIPDCELHLLSTYLS